VILDLKMPGTNGMEMLRALQRGHPQIIVVVITGYATVQSAVEAMKTGAYDFLPKPFTPQELRAIVDRAIEKRQLLERSDALEREKETMREHFAAMVSHQLKAPISNMAEHLELLRKEMAGPLTKRQEKVVDCVSRQANVLLSIIDDWLTLSGLEMGLGREGIEAVDLQAVIQEAWDAETEHLHRPEIVFRLEETSAPASVMGHRGLVRELFGNLFSNAVKYTPGRGQISVRITSEGAQALVEVKDEGIGIAEEDLPRIFEPFYRRKRAEANGPEGTGLGLSIVRKIAELHGGSISVTSRSGGGTTFRARFPSACTTNTEPPAK